MKRRSFVPQCGGAVRWARRATLLLLCVSSASGPARGVDDAGTQSPFVLGAGSRALAMGRAAVALSSDPTAVFWNPARLGVVQQTELSLFRTELFDAGNLYHAGFFSYPTLEFGTLGIGFQKLDVTDIQRRDARNRQLGDFDAGESSLLLGYGRRAGSWVALGGALRVVQQSVDTASDASLGLNLGVSFERGFGAGEAHRLGAAATLQNAVEPKLRLQQQDVPDPRSLSLGLAYAGRPASGRFAWAAAADVDLPSTASSRLGLGAEIEYLRALALRVGMDAGHLTFGCGVAWRAVRLDYALRAADDLSRNDRLTLTLRLGRNVDARRLARQQQRERVVSEQLDQLLHQREADERARARADADTAFAAGRLEDAARLYRRVLALDPNDAAADERLRTLEKRQELAAAAGLLESGEAGRALAAYQAIEERWPGDPRTQAGLETARQTLQLSADRERQLNALFKQALARSTNGDFAGADAALAELLRLQPDHELGLELRERVQTARHSNGEAELQKARTLAAGGDYDAALAHLESARRLLGDSAALAPFAVQWSQARAASRTNVAAPFATAAPSAESTTPPVPEPRDQKREAPRSPAVRRELDRQFQEGLAAFHAGQFERATRNWRAVWVEDPDYAKVGDYLIKAYLYEGIALYSDGKYDAAIERCKRVLEIDPANEKALRYVGRIQEEKAELEQIEGGRVK